MTNKFIEKTAKYAAFCVLCAIERTPEKEVARCARDLDEDDGYTALDFEFSIRKGRKAVHYFSKVDIRALLQFHGSTPISFYGEEKAEALGLI